MTEPDMCLEYESKQGDHRVQRKYYNHGEFLREVEVHERYNYSKEWWDRVYRFTHDYELLEDKETLAGDGSNWKGTGRYWREHFQERHLRLVGLRFKNENIHD